MIARIALVLAVLGLFGCSGAIDPNDDLNHDGIVSIDEQVQFFIRNEQLTDIEGYAFSVTAYSSNKMNVYLYITKNDQSAQSFYYDLDNYKDYEHDPEPFQLRDDLVTIPLGHQLLSQYSIRSFVAYADQQTGNRIDDTYDYMTIESGNRFSIRYRTTIDDARIYTCYMLSDNGEIESQPCPE